MLAFKYIARGFSQNNAHTKDVYSTFGKKQTVDIYL